jgi:hypothetical protein
MLEAEIAIYCTPFSEIFDFFEKKMESVRKQGNRNFCFQHFLKNGFAVILTQIEGNQIQIGRVIQISKNKSEQKI